MAPKAAETLEVNRVFITYVLCFCGWRVQYVLRGDTPAGAKKTDKDNSCASENEGGNEASTGDADGEDDPGTDDKSAEDDGTNGGEADAKEDKKTKKKKKNIKYGAEITSAPVGIFAGAECEKLRDFEIII